MAEIEITLPTVQYGNVKATFSPEEFGLQPTDQLVDPTALGIAVAVYLNLFTQGFKAGSQMDVSAPQGASQGAGGPNPKWTPGAAPTDPETLARVALDEGLGGVTEVPENEYDRKHEMLSSGLEEDAAPWDKPAVDAKPKPWETGSAAPIAKPVLDTSW